MRKWLSNNNVVYFTHVLNFSNEMAFSWKYNISAILSITLYCYFEVQWLSIYSAFASRFCVTEFPNFISLTHSSGLRLMCHQMVYYFLGLSGCYLPLLNCKTTSTSRFGGRRFQIGLFIRKELVIEKHLTSWSSTSRTDGMLVSMHDGLSVSFCDLPSWLHGLRNCLHDACQ